MPKVPRKELIWYFDPISPYGYFFANKLFTLIKPKFGSLKITPIPILFAGLLNTHGQKGPAEIPAKRDHMFLDCFRQAHMSSIPFKLPPAHPFNPLLPLRTLTAVEDDEDRLQLSRELLHTCWGLGKDITLHENILAATKKCKLDGHEIFKRASEKDIKDKLKKNTDDAIKAGIFGVPSAIIDGDALFWGSDRFDQIDRYLEGGFKHFNVTEARNQWKDLPRGADRKIAHNTPPKSD
eukprot:gene4920-5278_t